MSRIERDAANYFTKLFDQTRRLEPNIPTGEKGKITDGYVDVFKNEYNQQTDHLLKDDNYIGRLHVQVKGKAIAHSGVKLPSFELDRNELENIKKVGGVILLVSGFPRDDSQDRTPYYADLAPSNVDFLLEQMTKTQVTKAVPLSKFPTEKTEVYRYIRHLQVRQSEKSIITPNEHVMENAKGFTVTLPYEIDLTRPQFFGGPESSAIIALNGPDNESQVVDAILQITPQDYVLHEIENLEISCGDVQFRNTRKHRTIDGKTEIFFSPGISAISEENSNEWSFTFRYQTTLHYALLDLKFIQALSEGNWVTFNGEKVVRFEPNDSRIKDHLEPIAYFTDLLKLCTELSIDPKLFQVADLPESSWKALEDVCICMFHGGKFKNKQGIPLRHTLELGGSTLQLLWTHNSEKDAWLPTSFFDSSKHVLRAVLNDHESGEPFPEPVTPFEFFSAEELCEVLNLNPNTMVDAYRRIPGERTIAMANATVLKLIGAADRTLNRRQEFLSMATDLNNWTIETAPDCTPYLVNQFQIKKRMGSLDLKDMQEIQHTWQRAEQKDYGDESLSIEIATSILLGKPDGVDYLLDKMNPEDREFFKRLPIYHLHENREEQYVVGVPDNEVDWARVESHIEKEQVERLVSYRIGKLKN